MNDMLKQCFLCDQSDRLLFFRWGAYYCDECLKRHPEILCEEVSKPIIPEAIARINLYPTDKGGRTGPVLAPHFGCPIKIDGKDDCLHDCRIILEKMERVSAGDTFTAPMVFLCPELVAPWLKVGMKFKLWEGRFIGEGEVLHVYYKNSGSET